MDYVTDRQKVGDCEIALENIMQRTLSPEFSKDMVVDILEEFKISKYVLKVMPEESRFFIYLTPEYVNLTSILETKLFEIVPMTIDFNIVITGKLPE